MAATTGGAEEAAKRLILHFNVPKTLILGDPDGQGAVDEKPVTTEMILRGTLVDLVWGTINAVDQEWVLAHPDVQVERPSEDLVSYREYLHMKHPLEGQRFTIEENTKIHEEKILAFTQPGAPGQKMRASFDQMVKCIAFPKALAKACGTDKSVLNEAEFPYDPNADTNANLTRYGRYIIIPAFYVMLQNLIKAKREFSVVLHSMSEIVLQQTVEEVNAYCDGQHPCFSGANKTKKVLLNGEKGSKDMRIKDMDRGVCARREQTYEFEKRPTNLPKEGEEMPLIFDSTVFKKASGIYAGLVHRLTTESSILAVQEDLDFWDSAQRGQKGGKLFLLDSGETEVHQVYFDGTIGEGDLSSLCVQEAVGGKLIDYNDVINVHVHGVNAREALLNPQYFSEALAKCEAGFAAKVAKSRAKPFSDQIAEMDEGTKEYLYRTIIPTLFPALEQCTRLRPKDPIEFLAFYLMRHADGYNKTVLTSS